MPIYIYIYQFFSLDIVSLESREMNSYTVTVLDCYAYPLSLSGVLLIRKVSIHLSLLHFDLFGVAKRDDLGSSPRSSPAD